MTNDETDQLQRYVAVRLAKTRQDSLVIKIRGRGT